LGYEFSSDVHSNRETKFTRYSVFSLADKLFAIEISHVKEVIKYPNITALPNVEATIIGISSLRGTLIPVIDLRHILGLVIREKKESDMVLLLEGYNMSIGIIVERVLDFANIEDIKIQIPSRSINPRIANYIRGFYEKEGTGTIYLFDPEKLFTSGELLKTLP
jgi:purine-binding chemotaxis protein CheW